MATLQEAKNVFDGVAWRYDLTNRVISLKRDRLWRDRMSKMCAAARPERVLDAACGTADQLLSLKNFLPPHTKVVGFDLLEKMLRRGQSKCRNKNKPAAWSLGDGSLMPFQDNSFDAVTISWGLRNMPTIESFLSEAFRVLRPGGTLWVLEFSAPSPAWLQKIYFFYLRHVMPVLGGILTGRRASYDYLAKSVTRFPDQKRLISYFEAAGFKEVSYWNQARGVVAIHKGKKAL